MIERWKSYSELQKLLLSALAACLLLVVAYQGSFSASLDAMATRNTMRSALDSLQQEVVRQSSDKNASMRSLSAIALPDAQAEFIRELERAAKQGDLQISEVPRFEVHQEFGRQVVCLSATVEGRFHEQVKLVSALENDVGSIHLQSVRLRSTYDRKKKRTRLFGDIELKAVLK